MRSFGNAVVAAVLLSAAIPLAAQTSQAQRIYNDALERERQLRSELTSPGASSSVLTRVRALVGAYEDMSRLFPGSGYADDALWQGARLAADAFWQFGDATDRSTSLRLFGALKSRYPSSSFVRQVPEHTKRLTDAKAISAPASQIDLAGAPPVPPRPVPASAPPPVPSKAAVNNASAPATARPTTSGVAPLTAIRREVLPEVLRITLELGREVAFYDERIDGPPRVFIDLKNTRAVEPLRDAVIPYSDDMVKQVRVGQQADLRTRVVLDLRGAGRYSVYTLYDPYRVVIDFERAVPSDAVVARNSGRGSAPQRAGGSAVKPTSQSGRQSDPKVPVIRDASPAPTAEAALAPAIDKKPAPATEVPIAPTNGRGPAPTGGRGIAPSSETPIAPTVEVAIAPSATPVDTAATVPPAPLPPSTNRNGNFSLSRQLGLGIAKIVIDAGHGGHDPGAQARGITEADLVLDVALRLEKLLAKDAGFEVVLTRRTNTFVSLEERTALANRVGADLFLSIHSNASSTDTARGIETYFLNFAPNPEAEAVAARENAGGSRNMRSLPDIVRAIALNNKIDESRDFASMVQNAMFTQMRKSNRELRNLGVKQAPFMVLVGATMPSILAEISFITNRQESTLLKTDKYRQQIADSLYAGVIRYQQSLKRVPAIATK